MPVILHQCVWGTNSPRELSISPTKLTWSKLFTIQIKPIASFLAAACTLALFCPESSDSGVPIAGSMHNVQRSWHPITTVAHPTRPQLVWFTSKRMQRKLPIAIEIAARHVFDKDINSMTRRCVRERVGWRGRVDTTNLERRRKGLSSRYNPGCLS